jgi:hypothetical protein
VAKQNKYVVKKWVEDKQNVATLSLGLQPKQGLAKVRAKYEARESHFMLSRVQENVRK